MQHTRKDPMFARDCGGLVAFKHPCDVIDGNVLVVRFLLDSVDLRVDLCGVCDYIESRVGTKYMGRGWMCR